jgi:hypothetical protein
VPALGPGAEPGADREPFDPDSVYEAVRIDAPSRDLPRRAVTPPPMTRERSIVHDRRQMNASTSAGRAGASECSGGLLDDGRRYCVGSVHQRGVVPQSRGAVAVPQPSCHGTEIDTGCQEFSGRVVAEFVEGESRPSGRTHPRRRFVGPASR